MKLHIAGLACHVDDRAMQRCAWCGDVLFEVDDANTFVAPNADGSPGPYPTPWKERALVAVEGNGKWVQPDDGGPLPLQFCGTVAPKLTVVTNPAERGAS
jgi:hypothetical protein